MKRIALACAAIVALTMASVAVAAAPSGNKISCEAECTLLSPNKALVNPGVGEYGAVYTENTVALGTPLSDISKLGFNYSGTEPYGGAPRISIGIDGPDVGSGYDAFAFVDAAGCNDGSGKVDVINDPTCTVWYQNVSYANWAAFVAAHPSPDYSVGYEYTFVVADAAGTWTIWNVQLGAKSRGGK